MAGTLRRRDRIWWGRIRKAGQKDRERSLETESKAVARTRLAAWAAELEAVRWREPVAAADQTLPGPPDREYDRVSICNRMAHRCRSGQRAKLPC